MARFLLYALGGILILAGIIAVAFQMGVDEILPGGVIWAIVLVLIGILVVGLSARAPAEPPVETRHEHRVDEPRHVEEHHHHDHH